MEIIQLWAELFTTWVAFEALISWIQSWNPNSQFPESHRYKATLKTQNHHHRKYANISWSSFPMQMGPNSILKRSTFNKTHSFFCSLIIMYHMPYILQLSQECWLEGFLSLVLWTTNVAPHMWSSNAHHTHAMYMSWQVA